MESSMIFAFKTSDLWIETRKTVVHPWLWRKCLAGGRNCLKQCTDELCSKFLFISWPRIQSLRRSLRSLTFSKVLLTAQQFQRTSLRISYGKHRQTKELSASGKHMPGRCKIFTRSAQVPQVRLAKCCFHWLLNCRSLRRFRCSVGIDPFLSVPLGSSLAKTLCYCESRSLLVFLGAGMPCVWNFFGCQSGGLPRFVHLGMVLLVVRCDATRSCYSCAGWRGLVQEKKGDFTVHHLWAGVCKKTFYSLLQHKGHSQCMRHMGRGSLELNSRCAHLCGWVKKT